MMVERPCERPGCEGVVNRTEAWIQARRDAGLMIGCCRGCNVWAGHAARREAEGRTYSDRYHRDERYRKSAKGQAAQARYFRNESAMKSRVAKQVEYQQSYRERQYHKRARSDYQQTAEGRQASRDRVRKWIKKNPKRWLEIARRSIAKHEQCPEWAEVKLLNLQLKDEIKRHQQGAQNVQE